MEALMDKLGVPRCEESKEEEDDKLERLIQKVASLVQNGAISYKFGHSVIVSPAEEPFPQTVRIQRPRLLEDSAISAAASRQNCLFTSWNPNLRAKVITYNCLDGCNLIQTQGIDLFRWLSCAIDH